MQIKGRIRVAKQVLEERLEIETRAMEDITITACASSTVVFSCFWTWTRNHWKWSTFMMPFSEYYSNNDLIDGGSSMVLALSIAQTTCSKLGLFFYQNLEKKLKSPPRMRSISCTGDSISAGSFDRGWKREPEQLWAGDAFWRLSQR